MALRHLAHSNGADLVFCSLKEKKSWQNCKKMLEMHVFDTESAVDLEVNPSQSLNVPATLDALNRIDEPPGAGQRRGATVAQMWHEQIYGNNQYAK